MDEQTGTDNHESRNTHPGLDSPTDGGEIATPSIQNRKQATEDPNTPLASSSDIEESARRRRFEQVGLAVAILACIGTYIGLFTGNGGGYPIPEPTHTPTPAPTPTSNTCQDNGKYANQFRDAKELQDKLYYMGEVAGCNGTSRQIFGMVESLYDGDLIASKPTTRLTKELFLVLDDIGRNVARLPQNEVKEYIIRYVPNLPLREPHPYNQMYSSIIKYTLLRMSREKFDATIDRDIFRHPGISPAIYNLDLEDVAAMENGRSFTPRLIARWIPTTNPKTRTEFKPTDIDSALIDQDHEAYVYAANTFLGKVQVWGNLTLLSPLCGWLRTKPRTIPAQLDQYNIDNRGQYETERGYLISNADEIFQQVCQ